MSVLRLTIRNLISKKLRFALTSLSVVLGVTFVVGVFVLTDSLRATFDDLASDIAANVDLTVRSAQDVGESIDREPVPADVDDVVAGIEGVERTVPGVGAVNTVIIDGDGEPILPQGPPAIGLSYSDVQLYLIEGDPPTEPGQFAVDASTADDNDLEVGQSYAVTGPLEQRTFELVGKFNFGDPDEDNSIGFTMAAFELATAQGFLGFDDSYSDIGVLVADGFDPAEVAASIDAALGDDLEVVSAEVIATETEAEFDEFISIFGNVLLAFALIAVFVSAFIINNTFQIIVGQRIRELGLLRAMGATGRQVSRSVVLEGVLIGVFSTVVGLGAGVLLSLGLRGLLNAGGFSLPSGPTELHLRTVVFAVVVGMGVTLASSVMPALRARRVSPLAAMRTDATLPRGSLRTRLVSGGVMTLIGAVALAAGLFGGSDSVASTLGLIAVGAVLVFLGVNVLSPAFATPAARAIGWPVGRLMRVAGGLARENAARTPRRTSSAAAALMIGLALVGMAAVVGESIKRTFLDTLDNAVEADYFIRNENADFDPTAGFSAAAADELEALPELDSVVRYQFALDGIEVDGDSKNVFATEFDLVERHIDPDVVSGSIADADPATSILLHEDPAEDLAVGVGDTITVAFPDGETETLTVAAVYADSTIFDNWVIDTETWAEHFSTRPGIQFVTALIDGFSDDLPEADQAALLESSRAAIDSALADYPTVEAENRVEFRQSQEAQLDSFLVVITVFLALALVIALIGIANTLALSVFERTREIGLLRAVGMSRRQLRRAIRWEAAIIAVFGALLGTVLGVVFGIAATVAIPDTFVETIAIPWGTLIGYVVVAAVASLLAAWFPARRASRLNVLDAIAYDG